MLKNLLKKYFKSLAYFYSYLKYKLVIALLLSLMVGILDGFGLSMFLPLLQLANGGTSISAEGMGQLGFIVEFLVKSGMHNSIIGLLSLLAVFFILKGLFKFASLSYNILLQQYFISKIRTNAITGLSNLKFKHFVLSDVGRIQNTLTGEVGRVVNAYSSYFRSVEQLILMIVYMVFAFVVDTKFAILVSIGGLLTNLIYKQIYTRTKHASKKVTADNHDFQGLVLQFTAFFKYLKATGQLNKYSKNLADSIHKIENNNKKIGKYGAILSSAREPLLIVIVCLVIYVQTKFLGGSLGPILVSLLFFYRALSSLITMQNTWNFFIGVSGSLENMFDFQKELTLNHEKNGSLNINQFQNSLKIENGSFGFRENDLILKNINLEITKNETIAFVGESGSGKSTLVNILSGLYPLEQGYYSIDNQKSTNINMSSFQNRIGYVTQDPVIFNDTIYNNITLWAPKSQTSKERIENVLKKASLFDFIQSLPENTEQLLGNNGINLSGGQKQRISIARELYKDIDILILDEATSALDSETEKNIQENIDQLKGNYTILIVAHRLSTIKNADRIVFMENRQIKNIAAFDDLIKVEPRFKRMVELQEL
jgi:ABC-type multidrug transport system fused ATPase/permease subunit